MISDKDAKKHINQLLELDKQTDKILESQYSDTMNFIKSHLLTFYDAYATENGLSVSQTSLAVNQWDIKQWKQALDQMNMGAWEQEAKDRAKVLSAQAGINRTNLINSIIGLGLIDLTHRQINTINGRIDDDVDSQIDELRKELNLTPKQVSALQNMDTDDDWEDKFWLASDGIRNNVENTVNNNLRVGLAQAAIGTLFALHSSKDSKPNKSIADRIKQLSNSGKAYLRTFSSIRTNRIRQKGFDSKGYKEVRWITEPGCCNLCAAIYRSNPYKADSAPIPGLNSHPNCRCTIVPKYKTDDDDNNFDDPTPDFGNLNVLKYDKDKSAKLVDKIKSKDLLDILNEYKKVKFSGKNDHYNYPGLEFRYYLAHKYGYDAKPHVVSPKEFSSKVDTENIIERYTDNVDGLINGNLQYSGRVTSEHSHGIYFGNRKYKALEYYNFPGNSKITATLSDDAVVVSQKQLKNKLYEFIPPKGDIKKIYDSLGKETDSHLTVEITKAYDILAMQSGIDAYLTDDGIMVVLNRGKLVIKDEDV